MSAPSSLSGKVHRTLPCRGDRSTHVCLLPLVMPRVRLVVATLGEDQPRLFLVAVPSVTRIGPVISRKATCTELTPSPSGSPRGK